MTVAGSKANLAVYSKQRGGPNGGSSYPMLRLLVLVSCGTRTVIDAVFGPVSAGETTYAPTLLGSLHAAGGRHAIPGRPVRGRRVRLPRTGRRQVVYQASTGKAARERHRRGGHPAEASVVVVEIHPDFTAAPRTVDGLAKIPARSLGSRRSPSAWGYESCLRISVHTVS
jgi:hypothetical protein